MNPTIAITAFGSIFLPLTLFVLLFRRAWLVILLCVSAVLQVPAVVTVTIGSASYGLTPFLVVAAVLACLVAWRIGVRRDLSAFQAGDADRPARLWLIFIVVSAFGALLLPLLFNGLSVIPPLQKSGAHGSMAPLALRLSNVAQAVNALLLAAVMLWLLQQRYDAQLPTRMLKGVLAAVVVSALVGLQQRLGWNGVLPLWRDIWESNPTYARGLRSMAGPVPRVGWPLVEASYASAWFAAVLGGFIAMFLANVRRHLALLGAMIAGFALANTLGATGMLAAGVCVVVTLVVVAVALVRMPEQRGALLYRLVLGSLVCVCVGLGCFLVLRHEGLLGPAHEVIINVLQGRSQTMLGDLRPHADVAAMTLLRESWGLGVGMGSNRASSYFATLASTGGILGLLLFCIAATVQMGRLARHALHRPTAPSVFFLGSILTALVAVGIAIPDHNWPVFWILLFGGLVCLARKDDASSETSEGPHPARNRESGDGVVHPDVDQREAQ